jgi:hypothetical protein
MSSTSTAQQEDDALSAQDIREMARKRNSQSKPRTKRQQPASAPEHPQTRSSIFAQNCKLLANYIWAQTLAGRLAKFLHRWDEDRVDCIIDSLAYHSKRFTMNPGNFALLYDVGLGIVERRIERNITMGLYIRKRRQGNALVRVARDRDQFEDEQIGALQTALAKIARLLIPIIAVNIIAQISDRAIPQQTGLPRRIVRAVRAELRALGFIVVPGRGRGQSTTYSHVVLEGIEPSQQVKQPERTKQPPSPEELMERLELACYDLTELREGDLEAYRKLDGEIFDYCEAQGLSRKEGAALRAFRYFACDDQMRPHLPLLRRLAELRPRADVDEEIKDIVQLYGSSGRSPYRLQSWVEQVNEVINKAEVE